MKQHTATKVSVKHTDLHNADMPTPYIITPSFKMHTRWCRLSFVQTLSNGTCFFHLSSVVWFSLDQWTGRTKTKWS